MGKHTHLTSAKPGVRKAPKASAQPPIGEAAPETTVYDAGPLLKRAAGLLETLTSAIEAALTEGKGNSALVREAAGMARAIAGLSAESRARERQHWAIAKKLSPELVMAYLRQLSPERRSHVIRELEQMGAEGSLLAT